MPGGEKLSRNQEWPTELADMSANVRKFTWTKPKQDAAQMLAADELTDLEIVTRVGITDRQLRRWKEEPKFLDRIETLAKQLGAACHHLAIARKVRRVRALDDRWKVMLEVIAERAAEPAMAGVPGGTTGLLVHTMKSIGSGPGAQVVDEYAVDVGLLKELREHERQAAQELGQCGDTVNLNVSGQIDHDHRFTDEQRVEALERLYARVGRRPGTPPANGNGTAH